MRYVKWLGLAVVVLAAMPFFGAGSASATKLCKELAETCPAGQVWEEKTELEGKLEVGTKAIFEAGKYNEKGEFELIYKIECNESVATGKTTNAGGGEGVPVLADISDLTFANNKGNCPVSKELGTCSITGLGKPWAGSFEQDGPMGNGDLRIVEKGGAGPPRLQFSCLGGTVTCIYGKNVLGMRILGSNPWFSSTNSEKFEKLTGSSGLCPAVAHWNAMYEAGKPANMWLSKK